MKVYMALSQDRYELPIAVAGSVRELAGIIGVKPDIIYSAISKQKIRKGEGQNRGRFKKYIEVEVDNE